MIKYSTDPMFNISTKSTPTRVWLAFLVRFLLTVLTELNLKTLTGGERAHAAIQSYHRCRFGSNQSHIRMHRIAERHHH